MPRNILRSQAQGRLNLLSVVDISLSNFEMAIDDELTRGTHTVAIHLIENTEEGFPHNVHVARLESGVEVEEIVQ